MIDTRKSLGGQIDCIFRDSRGKVSLLDFKTKSASYSGPSKQDLNDYAAQAGGYLELMTCKDSTAESRVWVDYCQTLVITPDKVKFLPPMDVDKCSELWRECWDRYYVAARTTFYQPHIVFPFRDDPAAQKIHLERCFRRRSVEANVDNRVIGRLTSPPGEP